MDSAVARSTEGTKKTVAPARSTAMVFSATPPTSPTLPYWSIVPVAATIRLPGQPPAAQLVDDAERHGQAGGRAADVLRVHGHLDRELPVLLRLGLDAEVGRRLGRARRSRCPPGPWAASPRVTDLCTIGPSTKSPTSLMEDSSTLSETLVPGVSPCSASMSAQSVGVGVAFDRGDHLGHLQRLGGGGTGLDPVDERAGVGGVDRRSRGGTAPPRWRTTGPGPSAR